MSLDSVRPDLDIPRDLWVAPGNEFTKVSCVAIPATNLSCQGPPCCSFLLLAETRQNHRLRIINSSDWWKALNPIPLRLTSDQADLTKQEVRTLAQKTKNRHCLKADLTKKPNQHQKVDLTTDISPTNGPAKPKSDSVRVSESRNSEHELSRLCFLFRTPPIALLSPGEKKIK